MIKIYYKKKSNRKRIFLKIIGAIMFIGGSFTFLYTLTPIFLWQIFVSPALASENIALPIPKNAIINSLNIKDLFASQASVFSGVNYYDASTWFPDYSSKNKQTNIIYNISIPRLNIKKALVSTNDDNLAKHLVNYAGTAIPPEKGNAVIFGHSTLPSLYKDGDYKTIFANALDLKPNDKIYVTLNNVTYTYQIFSITIVDPTDTSVLNQDTNNHILTIITCTPPGTVWKRLIIKSKLIKI